MKHLDFTHTGALRCIAILLITVGHLLTQYSRLFTPLGVGVAIFLFISGFGINESFKKNGLNCYWRKKITRVLLPYAIIISVFALSPIHIWEKQTIESYLLDITGLVTSYWYIGFLIKAYFVYWITSLLCRRHQMVCFLAYAAFALVVFRNTEAEQALSFPLGMMASRHIDAVRLLNKRKLAIGFIACSFIGLTFLYLKQVPTIREYETYWYFHIVQLLIKLPLAIACICASVFFPKLCAHTVTQFIGKISYEMYLLQMPFYGMASKTLVRCMVYIIGLFSFSWLFQKANSA